MMLNMDDFIKQSSKAFTGSLDGYINRCNAVLELDQLPYDEADKLRSEIDAVYKSVIPGFADGLSIYPLIISLDAPYQESTPEELITDIARIKAKLEMYRDTLIRETIMQPQGTTFNANLSQSNQQTQITDISLSMSLEQTMEQVEAITEGGLSEDEQMMLRAYLSRLDGATSKGKDAVTTPARTLLQWLSDKGVDVLIAVIPHIARALGML